jgi:predicted ATPase
MVDAAPDPGSLAGRDQELAALRGWRAEALTGSGRLVVLTGPPGIGKTRLAEELVGACRRGTGCAAVVAVAADTEGRRH